MQDPIDNSTVYWRVILGKYSNYFMRLINPFTPISVKNRFYSNARQFYWGMLNIDKRRSDTLHNSKHKPPVCNFSKGGSPTCWQFLSNGFKNLSQLILFLPLLFLCLFLCNTQFNNEKPYWFDKKSNTE